MSKVMSKVMSKLMSKVTTPRRAAPGFTLVELMTVMAVLGVLMAIGVPGLRTFAVGQQLKALAYDMTSDLLLARSEALKRNVSVNVTAIGTSWASGWTVSAGNETISSRNTVVAALDFAAVPAVPSVITFDAYGRVAVPSSPVRMTISVPGQAGANSKRCIQLDLSGRARSTVGACA